MIYARESLWKTKLGTRAVGLNRNRFQGALPRSDAGTSPLSAAGHLQASAPSAALTVQPFGHWRGAVASKSLQT